MDDGPRQLQPDQRLEDGARAGEVPGPLLLFEAPLDDLHMGQPHHHLCGGQEARPLEARFETGDLPGGAGNRERDARKASATADVYQASRLAYAVEQRKGAEGVEQQLLGKAIAVENADEVGPFGAILQPARIGAELRDGAGGQPPALCKLGCRPLARRPKVRA